MLKVDDKSSYMRSKDFLSLLVNAAKARSKRLVAHMSNKLRRTHKQRTTCKSTDLPKTVSADQEKYITVNIGKPIVARVKDPIK